MKHLFLGGLISLAVRLGILLVASLVLFWRSNRLKLPQINLYRVGLNCLTISITAVYWIFYSYKVRDREEHVCQTNFFLQGVYKNMVPPTVPYFYNHQIEIDYENRIL